MVKLSSSALLGTLLLVFMVLPLIHHEQRALTSAIFVAVFVVALNSIAEHRRQRVIGRCLLAPAILFALMQPFVVVDEILRILGLAFYSLAFGFMLWVMVGRLLRTRTVTVDTITTAVTGYVLIGMFWAFLYSIALLFEPGCIRGLELAREADDLFYFSFVTLTTLGYGDLAPATAPVRILAALEAVAGQLYVAVTIARLVGLQIAAGMDKDASSS